MSLESPLKKEMDKAARELDALQRMYNAYFLGGEDDPPRQQRRALDAAIEKIKTAVITATNASDKFQANSLVNRYKTMSAKWDKTINGIESGTIAKPKKRE